MDRQPDPFHCAVEAGADHVRIRPIGELDCFSVSHVEEHLSAVHAGGARRIELDLGSLSFLDSTGIALVVRWSRASHQGGYSLRVTNGSHDVRRLFELMAISHLLEEEPAEAIL
jgi:anti-sigma B factor antagonist